MIPEEEQFGDQPMPESGLATNYERPISEWQHGRPVMRGENGGPFFVPFLAPVMRPVEPGVGAVLGFTKQYSEDGPAYSFAAIRATNKQRGWFLSGPRNAAQPLDWDSLLDFIGGPDDWARTGVVTGWTPLEIR